MTEGLKGRAWWSKKRLLLPLGIITLLISARIALPYLVEWQLNAELANLDGYFGHVADVDLELWRGGATLEGIAVIKTDARIPAPFFEAPKLETSIQWSALFDGAVVVEGTLFNPQINFVKGPTEAQTQYGRGVDWQDKILSLVPLDINRFEIVGGEFHYRDFHSEPPVNVYVQNFDALLTNLANTKDRSEDRPARLHAEGLLLGSGALEIDARVDLLAETLEFDLDLKIHGLKLTQLNDLLSAYVGIDAEDGTFSLYSEVEGSENSVSGYAKPILERVEIHDSGESGDFLDRAGDAFVGAGLEILENQPHDRIATKVPISGSLDDVTTNQWAAVAGILRNAFIDAFSHGLSLNGAARRD